MKRKSIGLRLSAMALAVLVAATLAVSGCKGGDAGGGSSEDAGAGAGAGGGATSDVGGADGAGDGAGDGADGAGGGVIATIQAVEGGGATDGGQGGQGGEGGEGNAPGGATDGGQDGSGAQDAEPGGPNAITVCMFGIDLADYALAEDDIRAILEEKTNTRIMFETYPETTYVSSTAKRVRAGTAPDLLLNWGYKAETGDWAQEGLLVELYSLVKAEPARYPVLSKLMSDPVYKMYNDYYTGDPEKAYGFYTLNGRTYANYYSGDLVYNMKILREAGFDEPPRDIGEFMDYGRAASALGYVPWYPRNWNLESFENFNYSAFAWLDTNLNYPGGRPWGSMQQGDDGLWRCATTSDASKEAVKALRDMYADGVLPKEIGEMPDFDETMDMWAGDKIGCISYACTNPVLYSWALDEYKAKHPAATFDDIVLGPLLKPQGGELGTQPYVPFSVSANWVVPKASEGKAPAILDLIEYIGSAEGQALIFRGIEGKHYSVGADGRPEFDIPEWDGLTHLFGLGDNRCMYPAFAYLYTMAQMEGDWGGDGSWVEKAMGLADYTDLITGYPDDYLRAKAVTDGIQAEVGVELPPYYGFVLLSEESLDIRSRLKDISLEYLPAFITGSKDIDAEWPGYVQAYADAGVQRLADDFNEQVEAARRKYESLAR